MSSEQKVAHQLIHKKLSLALAESCTGGLLAHQLTNIPGSSIFFRLGVITYANEAKKNILNVPQETLTRYGAVSSQTALQMAKHVRIIAKSDFGIAITGIAGPTGATAKKPLGLTYIAISSKRKTVCSKSVFKGSRLKVKKQACEKALKLILKMTK